MDMQNECAGAGNQVDDEATDDIGPEAPAAIEGDAAPEDTLTEEDPGLSQDSQEQVVEPAVDEEAPPAVVDDDGRAYGIESVIEAILLATDGPISATRIAQILETVDGNAVRRHIKTLNERYEGAGTAFRVEAVAKGFQMHTLSVFNPWVSKLQKARAQARLSAAALETLAIVAYKQPILRADIEAVRGVSAGDMLVKLREANLVRIAGRAEEIGRPLLYGTTNRFLEVFGLGTLNDLPKLDPQGDGRLPPLKVAQPEPDDAAGEASDGEPEPTKQATTEPSENETVDSAR